MSGKSTGLPLANLNEASHNHNENDKILVKDETTPQDNDSRPYVWMVELNTDTIITGLYMLAAVSLVIIVYFVVKTIRLVNRIQKP